jgi:NhaP-type Na+/H+ and K+/H+ antiporter
MKFGKAEGTPEEISNFIALNNLNSTDFFEEVKDPLHWKWILIPSILFAVSAIILVLFSNFDTKIKVLLFLVGMGFASWTVGSLQVRFKNSFATTVVGISAIIILLIASGLITPMETLEVVKKLK